MLQLATEKRRLACRGVRRRESRPRCRFLVPSYAAARRDMSDLEAVDLDVLLIETEAVFLVDEEFFDLEALVALQLDHLAHSLGLGVADDRAIASWTHKSQLWRLAGWWHCGRTEFLLDDLEDLFMVKLGGYTLHGRQGLASITLWKSVSQMIL
jgi:hypothetical protein